MKKGKVNGSILKYISCVIIFVLNSYINAEAATRIVVIGSSTAAGYSLPAGTAWVTRYRTYLKSQDSHSQVINLAVSGYTTYQFMPDEFTAPSGRPKRITTCNISQALTYHPDAIIVNLPTNDIGYGYSIQEILNNYATIVKAAEDNGVPVWITTTQPASWTSSALRRKLTELNNHLYDIYGDRVIDFWSDLGTSTGAIKNAYKIDNVHMNSAAHKILFNRVLAKNIHEICDKGTRKIYLVGGATDALWEGTKAIPFVQDQDNPNMYTLVCELRHKSTTYGTQFRILNQPDINGTGLSPLKKDESLIESPIVCVKRTSSASNTYRWTVPADKQGYYKLKVDISNNTLMPEYLGEKVSQASELYLIGGATDGEWDMSKAIPFEQDPDNPDIFRLTCLFKNKGINLGDRFKIVGKQDSVEFNLHPQVNGQALKTSNPLIAKLKPAALDYKWTVPTGKQGYYKLTVDISSKTLTADYYGRTEVLPSTLYLIGGVTEAGWGDGTKGIPFEQDSVSPNIFTLKCLLKYNNSASFGDQFRILEQLNINKGKGLYPKKNKQSIAVSSSYVEQTTIASNNVYRWLVPKDKQGYYNITVDILAKTLNAEYLGDESSELRAASVNDINVFDTMLFEDAIQDNYSVQITAYADNIRIISEIESDDTVMVQVFTLDGRIFSNQKMIGRELIFSNVPKGIYVVNVSSEDGVKSQKVIIK